MMKLTPISMEEIIATAARKQASDVHLTAGESVWLRVHGTLQQISSPKFSNAVLQSLLAELLTEKLRAVLNKTGEVDCALDIGTHRCRLNVYLEQGQYALAFRILPGNVPDCTSLCIPKTVQQLADLSQGLVLVTGATGSGKSTTLAALVQRINQQRAVHIITLEDPIEYVYQPELALIHQREIGRDTQSFASGLRAALREDPDVLLVGELRDAETIGIALTAAETGHLVLGTLHTRTSVSSINRIIDVLPDKDQARTQLADVLQAVVGQRLMLRKDQSGCIPAFEVLQGTEALRNLIREGRTHQVQSYLETGKRYGMITMDDYLKNLRSHNLID